MTQHRSAVGVVACVLAAAVVCGCGAGDDEPGAAPSTSTSVAPSSAARPTSSAPAGGPGPTSPGVGIATTAPEGDDGTPAPPFPADTDPDTAAPAAGSAITVTDVRTGRHEGYDRVVFYVAGTGMPGWDVRYVAEALGQASGEPVRVTGNAVLQVTITGVGNPTDTGIDEYDGTQPLPGAGTDVVTEVVWDSTFEGSSVAFVGVTEQVPFRVYLLQGPTRVVLDVAHPD
jgi:hypothetical protein